MGDVFGRPEHDEFARVVADLILGRSNFVAKRVAMRREQKDTARPQHAEDLG